MIFILILSLIIPTKFLFPHHGAFWVSLWMNLGRHYSNYRFYSIIMTALTQGMPILFNGNFSFGGFSHIMDISILTEEKICNFWLIFMNQKQSQYTVSHGSISFSDLLAVTWWNYFQKIFCKNLAKWFSTLKGIPCKALKRV